MKRAELEALGLTKEQIDAVMKVNGTDIEDARTAAATPLNEQIKTLQGQLTQRDTDMAALKEQLTTAQTDAGKLADVTQKMTDLQTKYDTDTKNYQQQLKDQAFGFALDKKASALKFTSNAARKQFMADVRAKGLTMEGENILGLDDYIKEYQKADPGIFAPEDPGQGGSNVPPGNIVAPKGGDPAGGQQLFNFGFTPIRPMPKQ